MATYEQCVTDTDGRCTRWTHDHAVVSCPSDWHGPWSEGLCVDCGKVRERVSSHG